MNSIEIQQGVFTEDRGRAFISHGRDQPNTLSSCYGTERSEGINVCRLFYVLMTTT